MKRFLGMVGILVFLVALSACPSELESSSSVSSTVSLSDPNTVLKALPDPDVELPNSLGNDMKMKMKMKMKTVGDKSVFSINDLPDVMSQGWFNLVSKLVKETEVAQLIRAIRTYASNNTVAWDTEVDLGGRHPDFDLSSSASQNNGATNHATKFIIKKVSDREMNAYITQLYDTPGMNGRFYYYIYFAMNVVLDDSGKSTIKLHSLYVPFGETIEGDQTAYMMDHVKRYAFYNEATGEMVEYFNGGNHFDIHSLNRSYKESDGSIVVTGIADYYHNYGFRDVAWGNDNYGGLISTWYDYEEGYTNRDIATEFYNSSGSFLHKSYGNTTNAKYCQYIAGYTNGGINLKDFGYDKNNLPNIIVAARYNDGSDKIIITNSLGNPQTNADGWDIYFVGGSELDSGDAIYGCTAVRYEGGKRINEYEIGYIVPEIEAYLGYNYYMENVWALKYLTLNTSFSSFEISREVTSEFSITNNFTDVYGDSKEYIYSWIGYKWWLDSEGDTNYNETNDILVKNISEDTVYIWKEDTQETLQQKGLFVKGVTASPKYFEFTQQSLVNSVKDNLTRVYNSDLHNFNMDAYVATVPAFPDTNLFPKVALP